MWKDIDRKIKENQAMKLISVVITTYKRPVEILKRAIGSVIMQSYRNLELFIVNDAPLDTKLSNDINELIQLYQDERITYIVHPKNMGACQARNTGIDKASGEFIAFLDDDDEWLPDKLEKQLEYTDNEEIGIVYCSWYIVHENGFKQLHHPKIVYNNFYREILKSNFIGSTSFPLLRLKAVIECGKFDINLVSNQDYDLWIRILKKYQLKFVKDPLVNYYLSSDSTFRKNNDIYIKGNMYIIEKYKNDFMKFSDAYSYHLNNIALTMLLKHDFKFYRYYKCKAFKFNFLNTNNYFILAIKVLNKLKRILDYISYH